MNQKDLMTLLVEATTAEPKRANEIHARFENAVIGNDMIMHGRDDREAGIRLVLDELYSQTMNENPALLPALFPVFAIICGLDKLGYPTAEVDWDVYYKYLASIGSKKG